MSTVDHREKAISKNMTFEKSLQRLEFMCRFIGLTCKSKNLPPSNKLKRRCVFLLNFFWLNSDVLGAIFWFIDGVQKGNTFVELTYIAPCITFSILANMKAIFVIHYEDFISDLIDELRKLEANDTECYDNSQFNQKNRMNINGGIGEERSEDYVTRDIIKRENIIFLHTILKWSDLLNGVLFLLFLVNPLILIAWKYYQTKELDLILPFLIIYPFDSHDIRYWPFVYLHQFWSVVIVLLNICWVDNLLYICCTYLGTQFRLLQIDIQDVAEDDLVLVNHDFEDFEGKCAKLVKRHQELIRISSMLDLIYAESTLVNFGTSSVLICLTGFNVIAMENVAYAVAFLVFLTASLLQIYMICFFGDFLSHSSIAVSDAVYNSQWYQLNAKSGKNLLLVQTRAQRPCKLTAFEFSDVNLKAFMSILRCAWSYFALLKTSYTPTRN